MPLRTEQSRLKTDLSIQPQLLDNLTDQEITFAQKQYQKMYSEQMAKLSWQIQKKKRFDKRMSLIQQKEKKIVQNNFKMLQKKETHNQINKNLNLQKKLKKYKLHHELWENKVKQIKYKEKQQTKLRLDKIKLFQKQTQSYWKHKQAGMTNRFALQFDNSRKHRHKSQMFENKDSKPILNTKQLEFLNNKTINRQNNQSYFSNKIESSTKKLQSHKNSQMILNKNEQLKRNSQFTKNNVMHILQFNSKYQKTKKLMQNIDDGFQKAMIKLAKIQKIKETKAKRQMNIKIQQTKPRKSIDPETYRALRVKTEYSKTKFNQYQNPQSNEDNKKTINIKNFNQSKVAQRTMSKSFKFISIKDKTNDLQEFKKRQKLKEELQQTYKKNKIIKAIRKSVEHRKQNQIKKLIVYK